MTQQNQARVTYQMAANSSAEAAASARAGASETTTAATDSSAKTYQGAEKRRTPRYKCEGKAEICEAGCDTPTFATFSDISLHGCYVETQATYPVGTELRIKLEANDYRIEAVGNVRVAYPYSGMGIALSEMSDDSRAQLKGLLMSVMRPSVVVGRGLASSMPAHGAKASVPLISDAGAAVQALINFFEERPTLTRDGFLDVLRQSQTATKKE